MRLHIYASDGDGLDPIERILPKLQKVKQSATGWAAQCPAHEDKKPSLTVAVGDDGKVLLNCHAGCSYSAIMAAINLRESDGFPAEQLSQLAPIRSRAITNAYDYRDEQGNLLYQTVRYHPKDFRQRHIGTVGEWVWSLNGCRRVLYRLPELLAADPAVMVWLVEGERDADYLASLGFIATTSPMGASNWRSDYADMLRGRHVIIVPDNDVPGFQYAAAAFESLQGKAASCRTLFLPNLKPGGDVSDWLDAGHTASDLEAMVVDAKESAEPPPRYKLHNANEVFEAIPDVEWVVGDLMTKGSVNALCGPAGSKKTYTAIDMAVCVAMGIPWLGRPVTQGPVLIVDEESGNNRLRRRLLASMKAHGADASTPIYWTSLEMFNFREKGELVHLDRLFTEVKPVLAIVDALADVMPGADENTVQDTHPVMQHMRALADAHQCANVVLHHSNKGGSYRGSTAIAAAVDLMLMIESTNGNDEIRYSTAKVRDTDHQMFSARLDFDAINGTVKLEKLLVAAMATRRFSVSEQYILDYLRDHSGEAALLDMCNKAPACTPQAARQAVYRLATQGLVIRTDGGRTGQQALYALTNIDRQARMGAI